MTQQNLTLSDQDRIILYLDMMRGFFRKILLLSTLGALVILILLYATGALTKDGGRIGFFLLHLGFMLCVEYAMFKLIVTVLSKQILRKTTKETVTGVFEDVRTVGRGKRVMKAMFITAPDGTSKRVVLHGLMTGLSGQRDEVLERIKSFQPGQTVSVSYITKPNLLLTAD